MIDRDEIHRLMSVEYAAMIVVINRAKERIELPDGDVHYMALAGHMKRLQAYLRMLGIEIG